MRPLLALLGCVLLGSCGNQPTAGGGSDQPNSLDVLVLQANGSPATGVAARWVSGAWNPSDTSNQTVSGVIGSERSTDSNGRVHLVRPDTGVWHLEVIDSVRRQVAVLDSVRNQTVRLQPAAEWSGYVASRGNLPTEIALAGTSRVAVIGPDRQFHMEWLPAGQYRILGKWNSVRRELAARHLDVGQIVTEDTLDGDSSEIELIDLERRPLRSALRGVFWSQADTLSGRWFQAVDGSSRVEPSNFGANPVGALRTEQGHSYLRVRLRLGSPLLFNGNYLAPWAAIGVGTAPSAMGLDWSGVSAVRVYARGRGAIRVQINSHLVDTIDPEGHFSATIILDSAWRWYEIPVRNLMAGGYALSSGVAWENACKGVHAVAFYAVQKGEDAQLELGALRVRGQIAEIKI